MSTTGAAAAGRPAAVRASASVSPVTAYEKAMPTEARSGHSPRRAIASWTANVTRQRV